MVDVVIPVYNGERFILQALNSVAAQSCAPARIIVVDDGSTDGTGEMVRAYKSEIPVEYVQKNNEGLSSARNAGIQISRSEYVAFLDADDEWYPEKLEEQLRLFRESDLQNLGVVYCAYSIIDDIGEISDSHHVVETDGSLRGSIFDVLLLANRITGSGSGVLIKRSCFDRVGLFDEELSACEDWDMWLRLAECYKFDLVPQKLVRIRRHQGNMQNDRNHMFSNQLRFFDKWLGRLPDDSACIAGWRRYCASRVIADFPRFGQFRAIIANILPANRRKLFSVSCGSLLLYLIFASPAILAGMVMHIIRESHSGSR